jgi:F-type H+-transporting ATPase subunit epsilon
VKLKILLPTETLIEEESIAEIIAEDKNGSFAILPRHIDFTTILVPGILIYLTEEQEKIVAVDEGVLVKYADQVLISVRNGVRGQDLEKLNETVENEFRKLSDREKNARNAIVKLETNIARKFLEFERP